MSDSPFRAAPRQETRAAALLPVQEVPAAVPAEEHHFASKQRAQVTPATGLLLRPRKPVPQSGFRRLVHVLTGGAVNPGLSAEQLRAQERRRRLLRPLRGVHVVTYLCLKGGVAKTSTAVGVAGTLASERPDSAILADFNPDAGDAAERVTGRDQLAGVTRLARAAVDGVDSVGSLADFLVSEGRLTVLPGEPDPSLGESLSAQQFSSIMDVLCRYFSTIHLDAGTGITHPIMPGILARTDTVVVPAGFSITGAKRAAETIEWLRRNGFAHLAENAIIALTAKDAVSADVDKDAVRALFPASVAVVEVPQDPHVADGAMMRRDLMRPATRAAYDEIGALICDRFHR